ncbi:pantoate--beta-alanine ligase [Planosporangium thailandense]|uniref:Pantothenate synthetase n=1 Tax=Planosporangium thailandense TaxID=765197 RepID=A0ABX0Y7I7_9ACTN|nr:pantoate--beta-alanine ligase [Planosporangium thailandense]NJC73983.1 pantoate--beta-alanine ligase [Planosporangium thailandense]
MVVARSRAELAAARAALTGTVGVVMTMGALHAGHASLLRTARAACDHVVLTVFVNPLQFGPSEDFDRYPRTFDNDLEIAAAEGADIVFAPTVDEMYPGGQPAVLVTPGPLGEVLEGATRPGHFAGALTVVCKLLHLTRPDVAYFGEKDYQQLVLIRAMARDLDLGVEIRGVPTVREPDGLALSSRNRYLSPADRERALVLSRALRVGAEAGAGLGESPDGILAAARSVIAQTPGVELDYLVLTDPDLGPAPQHGPARLLVAARVSATRLIDNIPVEIP